MKKYILIILILLSPLTAFLQADNLTSPLISIVPRPTQIVPGRGNFTFSAQTVFAVESQEQAVIARNFIDLFTRAAGITPALNVGREEGQVRFVTDSSLKSEAYLLEITPEQILIKASDTKGFFYALQSIRQLLPAAIESEQPVRNVDWRVPAMTVQDEPRFGFRGLLLDPVRCFIPKKNVLRIIDCMAMLKINKLHFHLTDDNGWRIEIKKYPRLTEIGAWRVDRTDVPFHSRRNPERGEPTPIGGFYTQEDIREIVAYAADRQIEVIPEIDVPAHSNSALAAYPQLACPVVNKYSKRQGTRAAVMEDQVSEQVKARRSDVLLELEKTMSREYRERFAGSRVSVLFEEAAEIGGKWYMMGHTPQYVRAALPLEDGMNREEFGGRIMELFASGLLNDEMLKVEFS